MVHESLVTNAEKIKTSEHTMSEDVIATTAEVDVRMERNWDNHSPRPAGTQGLTPPFQPGERLRMLEMYSPPMSLGVGRHTSDNTTGSVESHGSQGLNLEALGRTLRDVTAVGNGVTGPLGVSIVETLEYLSSGVYKSVETYYCQICFENRPVELAYQISGCGHRFCRGCFKEYIVNKITDGQVNPVCFHMGTAEGMEEGKGGEGPCGAHIGEEDISSVLDGDMLARYVRFKFSRDNKHARECPGCEQQQVGDPLSPEMVCTNCGVTFCYSHGGAHPGKTCAEHERATSEERKLNQALISTIAKLCPGCGTPVEKIGGCNQMTCYNCGSSFCWICGQQVDDRTFPVHFQWWNVAGCPNQQLQDGIAPPGRSTRIMMRAISFIQVLVIGPVALALTVVFSVGCCCILPCFGQPPRQLFSGCFSTWGNMVVFLLLSPVAFVFVVILFAVYLISLPLRLVRMGMSPANGQQSEEAVVGTAGMEGQEGGDENATTGSKPDTLVETSSTPSTLNAMFDLEKEAARIEKEVETKTGVSGGEVGEAGEGAGGGAEEEQPRAGEDLGVQVKDLESGVGGEVHLKPWKEYQLEQALEEVDKVV